MEKRIYLTLSDGSVWPGYGELKEAVEGEVVFTTASTGYPQTFTDPSYCGQIVIFAFPPLGIFGVDEKNLESDRVWMTAALVSMIDETEAGRFKKLSTWMNENNVPLLQGFDTRQLILKIRNFGSMMGRLDFEPATPSITELPYDMVETTSCDEIIEYGNGDITIGLMDYGVKYNIIKSFVNRGCKVVRFPARTTASEVLSYGVDGLILSNGPGDPAVLDYEVEQLRKMLGKLPIQGVCLGNQLLARACGAKTIKLSFGHRGVNQPVINVITKKGFQTSQNHQYAVDDKTLEGTGLEVTYRHLGDGTVEGLVHKGYNAYSVQFHPEASAGPEDASVIFDQFLERVKKAKGE